MTLFESEAALHAVAEQERDLLIASEILQPLRPQECLMGRLVIHQNVQITPTLGNFPLEVNLKRSDDSVNLQFDALTLEGMIEHYTEGDEPVQDLMQRAYIGAGLARMLFLTQGANASKRKLDKFVNVMSDQDKLLGRLYEKMDIDSGEGVLRKLINDANAPAWINGLRLALGAWKEAHGEDKYASSLESIFKRSLKERLARKPQYMNFATKIFRVSEVGAQDTFAEYIADLQIAGAAPMDSEEIAQYIKLLT